MLKILPIALVAVVSTSAIAQSAPSAAVQPSANSQKNDLERIVCEKQEEIGTRLGARKVCKTVKQWEEQRRIERDEVERVQRNVNQSPSG
jgi:hypothetical protein